MTKVWEDVKQEACRLYLSGASLSQVQNELRDKYNFKASARSFRTKFKEWGITRSSQLRELQSHKTVSTRDGNGADRTRLTISAPEIQVIPDRSLSEPPESATITPFNRSPVPSSATLAPSPLSLRIETDHPAALSPRSAVSRQRTPSYLNHALEESYLKLHQARTGDEVAHIITGLRFGAGEDCILHIAAARDENWVLDYILDYALWLGVNIDIEDSRRRTALEYAILADHASAVEILLQNGASVVRRNEKEQMPLHLAVLESSSVETLNLLLQHGADPEAPLTHKRGRTSTPMHLALERLQMLQNHQSRDSDRTRDSLCSIVELLLRSRTESSARDLDSEPGPILFLESWVRWESFNTLAQWNRPSRSFRLSHFLRSGCDPSCWLPRNYCPGQECKSLASFVFAHTSGSGLPELLVGSTDISKYGHQLLYCLLSPCSRRIATPADSTTYELIDELLKRMDREGVDFHEDPSVLHQILGRAPEPEKLTLIRLVHSWGLLTVNESRGVLTNLSNLEDDFRLRLTEILLSLPGLTPPGFWLDLMVQNYTKNRMYVRQSTNAGSETARMEFQDKILLSLQIEPSEVSSTDSLCIVQCIMHYWTKKLLEGDTFGYDVSNQQRVFGAVQSRQKYDLPPLPIPGDLVLAMFPHLDHRNRGNSITSAPGRADDFHSPDSTLGLDVPDPFGRGVYDTPRSLDSMH